MLLVSSTTSARADGEPVTDSGADTTAARKGTDRSHLGATLGLGTPVGEVGLEYTLVPTRHLEIGFAVGLADMIPLGDAPFTPDPQAAVMPRFRYPFGPVVATAGAGLSAGHYTVYYSPFSGSPGDWIDYETDALWANAEAGLELHLRGFVTRAYLGYGKVIAHSEVKHGHGERDMTLPDGSLPYLGLSLGHSF